MRRANWAHAITVTGAALAAIAAIGGLWAQAVASYWSQQTAKDQLAQSKEEDVRKTRAQASKVTYWVEHPHGRREGVKLHVLNRSSDPVSEVQIVLHISVGGQRQQWWLVLSNLRPCADIVYPATKLRLENIPRNNVSSPEEWPKLSDQGYWEVGFMYFVDGNGTSWIRTSKSLHERLSPPTYPEIVPNIIYFNDEEVNKAGLCEDESR
ncbi:hypothetical protein [Streptomyces sp. NPDC126514]|uniref:hypothetical protein n=1 Tax=Streptomyces sp. NPDC126514 TaxID=3155210 RepID=UPI00332DA32C